MKLKIGYAYSFKGDNKRLIYVGTYGPWYQFELEENAGEIWCELLEEDIKLLEEYSYAK